MYQPPFSNIEGTDTDDKAFLIESRSLALLRLAPIFLILIAMSVGLLSIWVEPDGDSLIRLCEIVISGSLGSLTSIGSNTRGRHQDKSTTPFSKTTDNDIPTYRRQ